MIPENNLNHWRTVVIKSVLFASPFMIWQACSSYDLGKETAKFVITDLANPTWEAGGIKALLAEKCDNCHTSSPSKFVPDNVKNYRYDISKDETKFIASYAGRTKSRVFESDSNPMPPHFATPLTVNEKAALKKYLEKVIVVAPVGACATTTSLTFADVKTITDKDCASANCHVSGGFKPLTSAAEFKAIKENVLNRLNEQTMPDGAKKATFKASADGVKVIEWLCAGADLK